jgi:tRNA dimethylallyltransferase
VVAGPTASGKSSLALQIAYQCGGEILCFDSTTVYRGLDIGTAKPTSLDRQRVPHHLLDLVEAGQEFSLAHFLPAAEEALSNIRARARQPILVGGSYLYLRAFLEGFQLSDVAPDEEFRAQALGQPLPQLIEELLRRDPASAEVVDLANPRRVLRALEVCRSGQLFSQTYQRQARPERVIKIGLQARPDWLKERIHRRSLAMLEQGWREEVERLRARGLEDWIRAMRFIGYPQILEGQAQSNQVLAMQVAEATWRLVKKQRTWGRSERDVHWFAADDPQLLERVWGSLADSGEVAR